MITPLHYSLDDKDRPCLKPHTHTHTHTQHEKERKHDTSKGTQFLKEKEIYEMLKEFKMIILEKLSELQKNTGKKYKEIKETIVI